MQHTQSALAFPTKDCDESLGRSEVSANNKRWQLRDLLREVSGLASLTVAVSVWFWWLTATGLT